MNIQIKNENDILETFKIIGGYSFNKEYLRTKNEKLNNIICLIVKDEFGKVISYHINPNIDTNIIIWHGLFLRGKFAKLFLKTEKGKSFSYYDDDYIYIKLTDNEIEKLIENKIYKVKYI